MFIYEQNGAICVTFKANKPVAIPEYTIVINEEDKTITVNGTVISAAEDTEAPEEEVKVEVPSVEELDNIPENDPVEEVEEDVTEEEVISACKAARIHNYIMALPDGYNTVLSESAINISKGQKQLLTIARAMLIDSNMLILDEATSNVDSKTERDISEAMVRLMKDKTCFVIAHRLSTVRDADLILVLDKGNVVEQGTHESLISLGGVYADIYYSQFEYSGE
jgi:ABC-type transport system involved in Fe-S cluster assembly fused permease/ATPase subunit